MIQYYNTFEDGSVNLSTPDPAIAISLGLELTTQEEIVYGYDGKRYLASQCPATPIELLREPKLREIDNAFDDEINNTAHVTSSIDGFEIDARRRDGQNIEGLITYYTEPIPYKGYSETRPNTTLDELNTFKREIYENGLRLYNKKWTLEQAVANAQTKEEIDAIVW